MPIPVIPWSDLKLGNLIGNGSFGEVYEGVWCQTRKVAIKQLNLKSMQKHALQAFQQESEAMWQSQGANVLTLHGICTEPGHCAMVMELMPNHSLCQYLRQAPGLNLSLMEKWKIALDMAKGLATLHAKGIVHGDFKSGNVLLNQQLRAQISDFGLARLRQETSSISTAGHAPGTIRWSAPELLQRHAKTTPQSDIYSLGMVLWEMTSEKLPFSDAGNEFIVMDWLRQGEKETIPATSPWKGIIEACWQKAGQRPEAKDILAQLQKDAPPELTARPLWKMSCPAPQTSTTDTYTLLPAVWEDACMALRCYYQGAPVPGYEIAQVRVIYHPKKEQSFSEKIANLNQRANKPIFEPK
jgi:serine/threonine protein kinase